MQIIGPVEARLGVRYAKLGYIIRNRQGAKAGPHGSPSVVKPPRRDRLFHGRINPQFHFREAAYRPRAAGCRKHEIAMPARQPFQNLNCNRRQWDFMRGVTLHALRRNRPERFIEINFGPAHFRDFAKSLAGYEKYPNERRRRMAEAFRSCPNCPDLGIIQHALARLFLTDNLACLNAGARRSFQPVKAAPDSPAEKLAHITEKLMRGIRPAGVGNLL